VPVKIKAPATIYTSNVPELMTFTYDGTAWSQTPAAENAILTDIPPDACP
jgi:hypothetical protein